MLANFSVAAELGDLIKSYLTKNQIELPRLELLLARKYPDGRMPITDWWQALDILQTHTQSPHIGIELGKLTEPAHGGALGYMVQTCENIAEALEAFQKYQRIIYEGATAIINIQGTQVRVEWPLDYGYSTQQSDDTLTAGLLSFLRLSTGELHLGPTKIGFIHDLPKNIKPYVDFFGCDVTFNSPCTHMEFPLAYATKPMLKADPVLFGILKEKVEHQLAEMPESEVFLRWFYQHLLMAMQEGEPTVETVAKRMMVSPRTLFRRLEERNLQFKDVLQETREQLARQYLTEGKFTHSEIASLLGYSEQSAFSRAFKRWTGTSPLKYQEL